MALLLRRRRVPAAAAAVLHRPACCRRRQLSTHAHVYDPHHVLGVRPGCTDAELKTAYRRLALTHHPDVGSSSDPAAAASMFAQISEAYETLQAQRKGGPASRAGTAGPWGEQSYAARRRPHQQQQAQRQRAQQESAASVRPSDLAAPGVAFAGLVLGALFLISRATGSSHTGKGTLPPQRPPAKRAPADGGAHSRRHSSADQPHATAQQELRTTSSTAASATAADSSAATRLPSRTTVATTAECPAGSPVVSSASTATAAAAVAAGVAADTPDIDATGGSSSSTSIVRNNNKGTVTKRARTKVKRAYGSSYLPHTGPGRGSKSPYGSAKGSTHGGSGYKLKPRPADWIEPTRRRSGGYRDAAALAREKAAAERGE